MKYLQSNKINIKLEVLLHHKYGLRIRMSKQCGEFIWPLYNKLYVKLIEQLSNEVVENLG
jgi:hypothetical protein